MSDPLSLAPVSYGLMNLTWKPTQIPDEQAFAAIKAAVDNNDKLTMLNSGEFYGHPEPTLNLQLLSRFYKANPDYADKTFLSVKGGLARAALAPDGSEENLRASVENINAKLGGIKKMDLFECARVDRKIPIEDVIKTLAKLKEEGHFKHIGLSECSAETIRRAHQVHPIAAVEVEYSIWARDIEKNGVLATCKDLGIPIVAYSPLGRGFLTGRLTKPSDLPKGDMRAHLDRFQPENWDQNYKIVEKIQAFADKKKATPVQICLAWLIHQEGDIVCIPGSTRVEGVQEAAQAQHVTLSAEEVKELRDLAEGTEIVGGRYNAHMAPTLEG